MEIRKKEQEKRMEKKIQREREMEKGEFDDKEAFVTSAYKKKLEERAEEEEREKKAAALEGEGGRGQVAAVTAGLCPCWWWRQG